MDKPLEFILVPKCPLFGDSTVLVNGKKILRFSFARLEKSMETRHGQSTMTDFVIIFTSHVQRVQVKWNPYYVGGPRFF